MKYHINPKTGNANQCHAKKRCRFNLSEEEHFSTKEEAMKAYEKMHGAETLQALQKQDKRRTRKIGKNTTITTIDIKSKTPIKEQLKKANISENSKVIGRSREIPKNDDVDWKQHVHNISQIEENLKKLDWRDPKGMAIETLPNRADYSVLGTGVHRTAFLHKPSGLVYKIPHSNFTKTKLERMTKYEQESYGQIDNSELTQHNIEYLKTYFLESESGTPVQVQEKIDFDKYCFMDWRKISREQSKFFNDNSPKNTGLADFTEKNIFMENDDLKEEKKLIMIDCLSMPEEEWFTTE